jgi:hypothetical protein
MLANNAIQTGTVILFGSLQNLAICGSLDQSTIWDVDARCVFAWIGHSLPQEDNVPFYVVALLAESYLHHWPIIGPG